MKFVIRKINGIWHWRCDLCSPPAHGHRRHWEDIIHISLPNHMHKRQWHHRWAAGSR